MVSLLQPGIPNHIRDSSHRKLHNEELNNLYSSPNIIRVIKRRIMGWAGHLARMGKKRGVNKVLVGKPEVKIPFWKPKHRWEDNMGIQEVGCGVWTGSNRIRIG
jgi:hypothetical protein